MGSHPRHLGRLPVAGAVARVATFSPGLLAPALVASLHRPIEEFWWVAGATTVASLVAAGLVAVADRTDPRRMLVGQAWLAVACMLSLLATQIVDGGVAVWLYVGAAILLGLHHPHVEVLSLRMGRERPSSEGATSGRFRMIEAAVGHPAKLALAPLAASPLGLTGVFALLTTGAAAAALIVGREVAPRRSSRRPSVRAVLRDRGLLWGAAVAALPRGSMFAWIGGAVQVVTLRGHSVMTFALIGATAFLLAPVAGHWGRFTDRHQAWSGVLSPAILVLGWAVAAGAAVMPRLEHWSLTAGVTGYVLAMGLAYALLDAGGQAEAVLGQLTSRDLDRPGTMWTRSAIFRVVREVGGASCALAGGWLATKGAGGRPPGAPPGPYGEGELWLALFGLALALLAIPARLAWLRRFGADLTWARPRLATRRRRRAPEIARASGTTRAGLRRARALAEQATCLTDPRRLRPTVVTGGLVGISAGLAVGAALAWLTTRGVAAAAAAVALFALATAGAALAGRRGRVARRPARHATAAARAGVGAWIAVVVVSAVPGVGACSRGWSVATVATGLALLAATRVVTAGLAVTRSAVTRLPLSADRRRATLWRAAIGITLAAAVAAGALLGATVLAASGPAAAAGLGLVAALAAHASTRRWLAPCLRACRLPTG